jgi:hypothetical protein
MLQWPRRAGALHVFRLDCARIGEAVDLESKLRRNRIVRVQVP